MQRDVTCARVTTVERAAAPLTVVSTHFLMTRFGPQINSGKLKLTDSMNLIQNELIMLRLSANAHEES